jgi:hypothetical protein
LYLNTGRMQNIEGMDDAQAFDLIDELYAHATQARYEYRHVWQVGDLVIWDNRSVMHQANADYDPRERRYLYRLMVKGVALTPWAHQEVALNVQRKTSLLPAHASSNDSKERIRRSGALCTSMDPIQMPGKDPASK